MSTPACYWIYILECDNGSYYVGCTKNLERRYRQHVNGTARARYTRSFKPVKIAQCWQVLAGLGAALRVEYFIKRCNRKTKELLIAQPDILRTHLANTFNCDLGVRTVDENTVTVEQSHKFGRPEKRTPE